MNKHFQEILLSSTGATSFFEVELIQNLWSGYGKIMRYGLKGSPMKSVVVKHVLLPKGHNHPRGWNTDLSHQRKLKSYQVEMAFYENYSQKCDVDCYIPKCLALETYGDEVLMVLEDLNEAGFRERKTYVTEKEIKQCISWLAHFHAIFLNIKQDDLWEVGTYWHLGTRPDELKVMEDLPLKNAAQAIDQQLRSSKFQTLVHGDAKLANFCFSRDGNKVAAVDFQYVGGGVGMKDLAYFVGSCLYEDDCEELETQLLDHYFAELENALTERKVAVDFRELEKDWRPLYAMAWTDFHRFMKGWSPGHWKIHSYSERLAREVVEELNKNSY
ncbi:MAG TPA: choline kinase [Bacteroidales bacterium]|nr:choline kinase [Bacteroidales bacterium]